MYNVQPTSSRFIMQDWCTPFELNSQMFKRVYKTLYLQWNVQSTVRRDGSSFTGFMFSLSTIESQASQHGANRARLAFCEAKTDKATKQTFELHHTFHC